MRVADFYSQAGRQRPQASRSMPRAIMGMTCPESVEISYAHGSAPVVATVKFDQQVPINIGALQVLQIGNSSFYGVCISTNYEVSNENGYVTTAAFEDMRTKLHDFHVFMQLNMQDSEGRWYHVFPEDWEDSHKKTYVIEMNQSRMKLPSSGWDMAKLLCEGEPISSFAIIFYLAINYGFTFSADAMALKILRETFPDNVDWDTGVKVIEAMEQVLSRYGLQMTFWGDLHCYISCKGFSGNAFVNALARGGATAICALPGATDGAIGVEISDRGRKACIIGGRNRYQAMYGCFPDWNSKFTIEMAISGEIGQAVLMKLNRTMEDYLKDLPAEWHDTTIISPGRTRNDLTVKEYIANYVGKTYLVNFDYEVDKSGVILTGDFKGINVFSLVSSIDRDSAGTLYPLSDSLVDDSERNYIVYGTQRDFEKHGHFPSVFVGQFPDDRVIIEDCSMEFTEGYHSLDCQSLNKVRITFSNVRYTRTGPFKPDVPGLGIIAERPVICLATEEDAYIYRRNENDTAVRSREIKRSVPYLRIGFIQNSTTGKWEEQATLLQTMLEFGMAYTVKAHEIAEVIADQLILGEITKTAGHINFDGTAGFHPDGIIDNVVLTLTNQADITERVNFTTAYLDFDGQPLAVEYVARDEFEKKTEKGVYEDELRKRARALMDAQKAKKDAVANNGKFENNPVADKMATHAGMATTVAPEGCMTIAVPSEKWSSEDINGGDIVIFS